MIESYKISGHKYSDYTLNIPGTKIDDGRYRLKIVGNKSISGASGYRTSSLETNDVKGIIIDYKYPVPIPQKIEIIPFYNINYDSINNKYSIDYALNYKCNYEKDRIVDGVRLTVSENIDGDTNESNFTFKQNDRFELNFTPNLSFDDEGKANEINFSIRAHDKDDNFYKRYESSSEKISKSFTPSITNKNYENHTKVIDLIDPIEKETLETWIDISGDSETKSYGFSHIKNNTLHFIPKSKRRQKEIDGVKYNFFYTEEGGPYYRSVKYLRKVGSTSTTYRRYDSIPVIFDETDEEPISLPSKNNLDIESTTYYKNLSNTLDLNLKYTFKSIDGEKIENKDEINYAFMTITNTTTGEEFISYDFRDKDSSYLIGLTPGTYECSAVTHNEHISSEACVSTPLIINVRPTYEEGINVESGTIFGKEYYEDSYLLDNGKKLFKVVIKWNFYVSSISNLKIFFGKKEEDDYAFEEYNEFVYNNLTIDGLNSGDYCFYFTYDSEECKEDPESNTVGYHRTTFNIPPRT